MTNQHKATDPRAAILLLRHIVGVAVTSGVAHAVLFGFGAPALLMNWTLKFTAIALLATLLNALWTLFFTARSRGRFLGNEAKLLWVIAGLVVVGEWTTVAQTSRASDAVSAHTTAPAIPKERKADELRRLYPRFTDMSDAELLTTVAREYPEVPIQKIATDLGIATP